ncbi:MAG: hypothetical protein ABIQ32_11360 [Sphingomicrobium sp.]
MSGAEQFEVCDFIYCGVRQIIGGKLGDCVLPLLADGTRATRLFARKGNKGSRRVVGGVYAGAKFSAEQASGLDAARFVRRWDNADDVMRWEAADGQAEDAIRTKKLEADAGRISEIERVLLPLRRVYHAHRRQNDHSGMEALRAAVQRALSTPPRVSEQDK